MTIPEWTEPLFNEPHAGVRIDGVQAASIFSTHQLLYPLQNWEAPKEAASWAL
jgi:hypothetical protein